MSLREKYDVVELIGSGSFGTVEKIRRKLDGKIMCWKSINFGQMSEKEKTQLVAEVNIMRELKSPFIVKYYDRIVDKAATKLYIIMEYCAGGDLGKLISKKRKDGQYFEEDFIWGILAQCVLALQDCHQRDGGKIIHRDLKPGNILLDENFNVKAADFGLAKQLSNHTRFAETNCGTPLYMSPEIIAERGYDEKADIWSLGCILYEMASLKPPFEANNAISLAMKIKAGKFNRIPLKYSESLFEVIKSMIQVESFKRPRIDEIMKLSSLQNGLARAQLISKEYHLNMKIRDLTAREAAIKSKEEELVKREAIIVERERSLQNQPTKRYEPITSQDKENIAPIPAMYKNPNVSNPSAEVGQIKRGLQNRFNDQEVYSNADIDDPSKKNQVNMNRERVPVSNMYQNNSDNVLKPPFNNAAKMLPPRIPVVFQR